MSLGLVPRCAAPHGAPAGGRCTPRRGRDDARVTLHTVEQYRRLRPSRRRSDHFAATLSALNRPNHSLGGPRP